MERISVLTLAWLALTVPLAIAQVLSPAEILDPDLRAMQQKHLADLMSIGAAVSAHEFPYHFYFSRKLDMTEEQEHVTDQRSIQFAKFRGQIVLQITGNYFGSYSAELMSREERARQTVTEVISPILKAAAVALKGEENFQSFAIEISQHVRRKTLGVTVERWENVVLLLPREDAGSLLAVADGKDLSLALQDATVLVDGRDTELWPHARTVMAANPPALVVAKQPTASLAIAKEEPPAAIAKEEPRAPSLPAAVPDSLEHLQGTYQDVLNRIVRDLDSTAHFIGYAPPVFIRFHKKVYLQLNMTAALAASADGSQYRLAALAFDQHVAHLLRPIMAYFKEDPSFEGIDFSASIRTDGKGAGDGIAVEYIFDLKALRSYEQYDCTGQQMINSGIVLVNGERVGLDLQSAETTPVK